MFSRAKPLVHIQQRLRFNLCDDFSRVCRNNYLQTKFSQQSNQLPLQVGMKINIWLINYQSARIPSLQNEGQHLTPNLKSKTCPEDFSRVSFFRTKHAEICFLAVGHYLRRLDVHAGPSFLNFFAKLGKPIWKMIPNISEIP